MIPVAEALRVCLAQAMTLPAETVPLAEALGRVLATDVVAPFSLPPFDNSAMDGFALRVDDVQAASPASPVRLPIAFALAAGKAPDRTLAPGTACRIMTGAVIPQGADGVINVEDVRVDGDTVIVPRPVERGDFVRRAGGDVTAGSPLFAKGTEINAPILAMLAAIGLAQVPVHRRPRVAILTSGDELVEPGRPLAPGEIYDSNATAMAAMVAAAGAIPIPCGRIPDEPAATRRMLAAALACDVVLSSGGVSMGEFDYVGATLAEVGTVHFTRVAQQPGKPLTFATVRETLVFGLPGNPVSTMVTLEAYVRPVLRQLMGHRTCQRPVLRAKLAEPLAKEPGRQLFLRARLELGPAGVLARLTGGQASNRIASMAEANALVIVPAAAGDQEAGAEVEAWVLDAADLLTTGSATSMMALGAFVPHP